MKVRRLFIMVLLPIIFGGAAAQAQVNSDFPSDVYLKSPINQSEADLIFANTDVYNFRGAVEAVNDFLENLQVKLHKDGNLEFMDTGNQPSFSRYFLYGGNENLFIDNLNQMVDNRIAQLGNARTDSDIAYLQRHLKLDKQSEAAARDLLQEGEQARLDARLEHVTQSTSARRGRIDARVYSELYQLLEMTPEQIADFETDQLAYWMVERRGGTNDPHQYLNQLIDDVRLMAYYANMSDEQAIQADQIIDQFDSTDPNPNRQYIELTRSVVDLLNLEQLLLVRDWPFSDTKAFEYAQTPRPVEFRVAVEEIDATLVQERAFMSLDDAAQQDILQESMEVYESCVSSNSYSTYHDCECVKTHFPRARLEDASRHQKFLLSDISKSCPNVSGVAKMALNNCTSSTISDGKSPEYCECVAEEVGRQYQEKPIARIEIYQRYNNSAIATCNNVE